MKNPHIVLGEALADARIRVMQCRNALAEALRTERLAETALISASDGARAPTVRPPSHTDIAADPLDGGWE